MGKMRFQWTMLCLCLLALLVVGCKKFNLNINNEPPILYESITTSHQTYLYVKPELRTQRLATLTEGERVAVLQEPRNKWLQVRAPNGVVGWVESRDILRHEYFDEWLQLGKQIQNRQPQMKGTTSEDAYLRLRPGRDTIKVYKMVGAKNIDIFNVAHTVRFDPAAAAAQQTQNSKKPAAKPAPVAGKDKKKHNPATEVKYDTWYLVRTPEGTVGWLYGGLVNINVPEELARYAENKIIVAWYTVAVSKDASGEEHPWYLSVERDENSNLDFDRIRVLFWSVNHHRYELAFRVQNLIGLFPVEVTRVDPGQPGMPSFKIRHLDESDGNKVIVDEYQMNGTQTKKVSSTVESI